MVEDSDPHLSGIEQEEITTESRSISLNNHHSGNSFLGPYDQIAGITSVHASLQQIQDRENQVTSLMDFMDDQSLSVTGQNSEEIGDNFMDMELGEMLGLDTEFDQDKELDVVDIDYDSEDELDGLRESDLDMDCGGDSNISTVINDGSMYAEIDLLLELSLFEYGTVIDEDVLIGEVDEDSALTYALPAEVEHVSRDRPPASSRVIETLPSVSINVSDIQNGKAVCAVCKDEMGVGEQAKQLPCSHCYHGDCITPWLEIRNTCPVCRHQLPTDDPDYERRQMERAARDQSRAD